MTFVNHQGKSFLTSAAFALILIVAITGKADDGYRLWLRYEPLPQKAVALVQSQIASISVAGNSSTADAIRSELVNALSSLLGKKPATSTTVADDATLLVGTPSSSPQIAKLNWEKQLSALGPDGYVIRSTRIGSHSTIVIASQSDIGALYGTFAFLRLVQTLQPISNLNVSERPRLQLRVLDPWDNLDGSIERGYAGQSLWNWSELPDKIDPRL